jgi:hypothetical protein
MEGADRQWQLVAQVNSNYRLQLTFAVSLEAVTSPRIEHIATNGLNYSRIIEIGCE